MERKYLLIGAAAAGLVLGFAVLRGAKKVGEVVSDTAQAVNPLNNDNVFNRGFESIFNGVVGKPIYEVLDPGSLDVTSPNNLINRNVDSLYKTVTGSDDTIGADIADGVKNVKDFFGSLF